MWYGSLAIYLVFYALITVTDQYPTVAEKRASEYGEKGCHLSAEALESSAL
jgi:hypothetical protein